MAGKGKRGFTMLELVIALAIVGITGMMTAHFLWPLLGDYHLYSKRVDGKYLCDTMFGLLEAELRFGRNFQVSDNGALRFVMVEADGDESMHRIGTVFGAEAEPFIPEDVIIEVKYKTDSKLDLVTMTMRVYSDDPRANTGSPLFQQDAVVRSLYPVERIQ